MFEYPNKKSIDKIISISSENISKLEGNRDVKNCFMYGDNFDCLSYLLNNCNMKGKIELIYIDPPFNTKQDFQYSETRIASISRVEKGDTAYSDNMERYEYFEFMRERLVLLRELLSDKGSIYLHIDYKVGHYIKILMDEIFGIDNFKNDITRIKSNPKNFSRTAYGNEKDMILFYAKNKESNIWNEVREELDSEEVKRLFNKVDSNGDRYTTIPLHAPGVTLDGVTGKEWRGKLPPEERHWRTNPIEFDKLDSLGLIEWSKTGIARIKKYAKDHVGKKVQDIWNYKDSQKPNYPTAKNIDMLRFIVKQSSNKDSLVLDCFSGGHSTIMAANLEGRNWIGIDNSSLSLDIFKKTISNF